MYPKVSKAQNAELRLRWCQIVLRNNHEPEYSKVKAFLHSQVCAGGGQRGGGRFCPSCSVLGVQCRAAPQPPLCRAGEAEVHTAAVPRHVGRLGGCPRVGHGDLLSHSPSAAHQRPQLRQEDPGLGGERLTAPAAPSPPSSAGCSALTARFLIKLGCFYPCVLLLFSASFSVKPRYSRLCCCAGAWGCLHRIGLTAPTCTHLGLDVPCRTPSTAGMGAGALGKVPASAPPGTAKDEVGILFLRGSGGAQLNPDPAWLSPPASHHSRGSVWGWGGALCPERDGRSAVTPHGCRARGRSGSRTSPKPGT